jgi:hypothetical protein
VAIPVADLLVMNYLDRIADQIRREVSPDDLPDENTVQLFRLYAVLALAKGGDVTMQDVHNAWSAWMLQHDPEHESIKPYGELDPEVKREDEPYLTAIREVASRL